MPEQPQNPRPTVHPSPGIGSHRNSIIHDSQETARKRLENLYGRL